MKPKQPFNDSLQSKLGALINKRNPQSGSFKKNFRGTGLPPVNQIGEDGVDHINIWENGSTELGVALSQMRDIPFVHSKYGKFRSIEGFWHYLRSVTHDDRCRMMYGYKAKKFGDSLQIQYVENFRSTILDAHWQKINQYPPLRDEVRNSTLPFDLYYLYKNDSAVRIRPAAALWIIDGMFEIRNALKENRNPDFTFLMDNKDQTSDNVGHANTAPLTLVKSNRLTPVVFVPKQPGHNTALPSPEVEEVELPTIDGFKTE